MTAVIILNSRPIIIKEDDGNYYPAQETDWQSVKEKGDRVSLPFRFAYIFRG